MFNLARKMIFGSNAGDYVLPAHMLNEEQKKLVDRCARTPDILKLSAHKWQTIFVVNECQRHQRGHEQLGFVSKVDERHTTVHYNGFGFTQSDNFVLLKKVLGDKTFPVPLKVAVDQRLGQSGSLLGRPAKIAGEIFSIRPGNFIDLDNYMLNGLQFQRKRVIIDMPFRSRDPHSGKLYSDVITQKIGAWMYLGVDDYWYPELNRLAPVRLLEKNSDQEKYYFFNEKFESYKP